MAGVGGETAGVSEKIYFVRYDIVSVVGSGTGAGAPVEVPCYPVSVVSLVALGTIKLKLFLTVDLW